MARRQQIQNPFQISMVELKERLKVCDEQNNYFRELECDTERSISYKESRRQKKRAKKTWRSLAEVKLHMRQGQRRKPNLGTGRRSKRLS